MIYIKVNENGVLHTFDCTVSDSVKYETVKFDFPKNWDGYTKTAVFRNGNITLSVILNSDSDLCVGADECYIPHEVIKFPEFTVSVFGVSGDSRVTASQAVIRVIQSGYGEGGEPSDPTPSEYEQLITLANETKEIAQSVRTDADNGVFKGDKGDRGPQGEKGDTGAQGIQGIQGIQGEKGDKGDDGYTPQKGVDYFTEEDIEEATKNKLDKPSAPPAVGDFLKVISVNEDGTFICEWADDNGGAVDDVQINGESIVEDGIAVIPWGSQKQAGVFMIKENGTSGILRSITSPSLEIDPAKSADIDNRRYLRPITSTNLDYAVKRAMTDGIGAAWTDTEKTGAWKRLNSIKTVMDEVAVAGAQYYLGEVTELNITLPEDAEIGQEIAVSWYNGDTASTLAIDGIMLDFDYTPSANTRSEISCLWDGTYWSVIGISQDVPSEVTV